VETKMKIKEYAANVSEYTEVVDAPYNHTGGEEVLDERPIGFIKGGLQKLGAKVLPGSYGRDMKGKIQTGEKANTLYGDFHEFLGQTGYKSTDTALKAFLQQQGINVDVDSIIQSVVPAPAAAPALAAPPAASKGFNVKLPQKAPAPTPVAESIDSLNRILVLSGRAPKKIINENKNILNEEIALNRGALNKIFMQVAQQAARPSSGGDAPAASGSAPAAGGGSSAPASAPAAGGGSSAPASAPAAGGGIGSRVAGAVKGAINKLTTPTAPKPAAGGGDFGGDSPAPSAGGSAPPVEPPTSAPAGKPGNQATPGGRPMPSQTFKILDKSVVDQIKDWDGTDIESDFSSVTANNPETIKNLIAYAKNNPSQLQASTAPASRSPALAAPKSPAAPGPLGGTKPGAAAASASKAQGQSTQNMNNYVKNVSSQINAAQTKPEKIELAKELINFMSDRKGSPEYDNAMGSASAVLKKAGLNNMLAPLKGGQTANQKPQGLRNPPAASKAAPKAAPAATPAPAADPDAAREQKRIDDLIRESRVLHRNSYIFIKKVLENTDLTLRDLGYRVSISESTSDSVTLIPR
jgi:hypothetical protein